MTDQFPLPNETPMRKPISAKAGEVVQIPPPAAPKATVLKASVSAELADTEELPLLHPAYIAYMQGLAAAPPPTKEQEMLTYAGMAQHVTTTAQEAAAMQNILPRLTPAESMQAAIDHEAQQQAMLAYRRRVHWFIAGAMVALAVAIVVAAVRT